MLALPNAQQVLTKFESDNTEQTSKQDKQSPDTKRRKTDHQEVSHDEKEKHVQAFILERWMDEAEERLSQASSSESTTKIVPPPKQQQQSTHPSLHHSYRPTFLTSFSWLPKNENDSTPSDNVSSAKEVIEECAKRMCSPGLVSVYRKPELPLFLYPSKKFVDVDKPPLLALMLATRAAGFPLDLTQSTSSSSSSSSSTPLTFVSYRNNWRKILSRSQGWRMDVQRIGGVIYVRRFLHYTAVQAQDVGHLFEESCTSDYAQVNEQGKQIKKLSSVSHPYRAVVSAQVGEFRVITSVEVDVAQPSTPSSSSSSPLASFIELKSSKKQAWGHIKRRDTWIQSVLGGVSTIVLGNKVEGSKAVEELMKNHASNSTSTTDIRGCVAIDQIQQLATDRLISVETKEKCFTLFHRVLTFLSKHVKEGKVYTVLRAPIDSVLADLAKNEDKEAIMQHALKEVDTTSTVDKEQVIALYEIKDGFETDPIIDPEVLPAIEEWVKAKPNLEKSFA